MSGGGYCPRTLKNTARVLHGHEKNFTSDARATHVRRKVAFRSHRFWTL